MKKFLQKNPFFRITIALILGIVCRRIFGDIHSFYFMGFFLVLSIVGLVVIILFKTLRQRPVFGSVFILALFVVLGFCLLHYKYDTIPKCGKAVAENSNFYEVELLSYPVEKSKSFSVEAKVINVSDSLSRDILGGNVVLYFSIGNRSVDSLQIGDRLLVFTKMQLPDSHNNPNSFDFGKYLYYKGFCATAYVNDDNWIYSGRNDSFSLLRVAEQNRHKLLGIYREMKITGEEFAVLSALSLGYKDALTPEIKSSFSSAGGSHVLSVSGLHVGIIYVMLMFLLKFMNRNTLSKTIKMLIIIAVLWIYAFITGLSPSVCRAALMFSMFALGRKVAGDVSVYNIIFASAFVLLVINPLWLFDVGFQLSYCAIISIIYFHPRLYKLIYIKNGFIDVCWKLFTLSVAAQICTAPISLYYFHQFPNLFAVTNFIVVPFANIIIYGAIAILIFNGLPVFSEALVYITVYATKAMCGALRFIENLPFAVSRVYVDDVELVLIFGFVVFLGMFLNRPTYRNTFATLLVPCLISVYGILGYLTASNRYTLTIFSDKKSTTISILEGHHNTIVTDSIASARLIADVYWLKEEVESTTQIDIDTSQCLQPFFFGGRSFAILTNPRKLYRLYDGAPLKVDYLIVRGSLYSHNNILQKYFDAKNLIVTASVPYFTQKRLREMVEDKNIDNYFISQQGCFILDGK